MMYLFLASHDWEGSSPALNTNSGDETSGAAGWAAVGGIVLLGTVAAICSAETLDSFAAANGVTEVAIVDAVGVAATAAAGRRYR